MKNMALILLSGLMSIPSAVSQSTQQPDIDGYVTRHASSSDFDVSGYRILCGAGTETIILQAHSEESSGNAGCPQDRPYLGEPMRIYGTVKKKEREVQATRIELVPLDTGEISGSAVIDILPALDSTGARPEGLTVSADGFRIRITGKTKVAWDPPLGSLAEAKAGDWIKYKGKLDAFGVLVAASVQIGPNVIAGREERLRTDNDYDPSAVPADAKQNFLMDGLAGGCVGSSVMGCDPKKFAPFKDSEMQARVEKIGNSLIPAYQRALPDSDPAKIEFRFQLIDTKLIREALAMPSGIILVPRQVVERMQNDSELAAVLADGIACALERQQYRTEWKIRAGYAAAMLSPVVPYAGLGMGFGGSVAREIEEMAMEQRGRVSLSLLHEVGYDIDQAPVAWWLLASKSPKPISEVEMPNFAAYLYCMLGQTWHNPAANTAQAH